MEITAVIALVDGATTLIERAVPAIQAALKKGEVSIDDQKTVNDAYNRLAAMGFTFTRPPGT